MTRADNNLRDRLPSAERLRFMLAGMLRESEQSIELASRVRNRYTSTSPSEIVTVRLAGGRQLQLFNKYFLADATAVGPRSVGPFNEARVYRHVLGPPHTLPRVFGTWIDEAAGEAWLVLEYLAEARRLMHVVEQHAAMEAAARWIGAFHADAATRIERPELAFLRRLDAEYFGNCLSRLIGAVEAGRDPSYPWLARLREDWDEAVAPLAASPATVVHAEYYPKNILVMNGGIYPIDWETASIGAGEIDFAMLLTGWQPAVVDRCIGAYAAARGTAAPVSEVRNRVAVASLLINVHWLAHSVAVESAAGELSQTTRAWLEQLRLSAASLGIV